MTTETLLDYGALYQSYVNVLRDQLIMANDPEEDTDAARIALAHVGAIRADLAFKWGEPTATAIVEEAAQEAEEQQRQYDLIAQTDLW